MVNTNSAQFKQEVQNNQLVFVDFYATWCGPCKMMAPVIEDLATELEGKVKVVKVNVDEEPNLAREYQVSAIPTLVLIKNGTVVNRSMGFKPKAQIISLINQHL